MQDQLIFGDHQRLPAEYLGYKINKVPGGITIDQDEYVSKLEPLKVPEGIVMKEIAPDQCQPAYKSLACKVAQLGVSSRPDICFDSKQFASKFGHATKKDFVSLNKILHNLKNSSTATMFRDLG